MPRAKGCFRSLNARNADAAPQSSARMPLRILLESNTYAVAVEPLSRPESPLLTAASSTSDAAPTLLSQMELDGGVVTRGHRRVRNTEASLEGPAVKRARQTKGPEEGGTMAMDLQNGHANGAPAPPSRLGSKQLIDRYGCTNLECRLSCAMGPPGRDTVPKPQGRLRRYPDPVCALHPQSGVRAAARAGAQRPGLP